MTLLAALLLRAFWRVALAWDIAGWGGAASDAQTAGAGAPVFWQVLDPLVGWLALLILALSNRLSYPREKLANAIEGAGLLLGLVAWWTSAAVPEASGRSPAELAAALPLALVAGALVWRELRAIAAAASRGSGEAGGAGGMNIEQLWRLVACQWVLVWVAAELFLRFKLRGTGGGGGGAGGGVMAHASARTLLFLLPAVGVLPNVLMAVGIRWWGDLVGRPRRLVPRERAWLLALLLQNLGAALVFAGPRWLGAVGAALMLAATALYLLGFPFVPGIGAGLFYLAWAWAAAGVALLGLERLMEASGQPVLLHFSAAWRIALTDGLPLTWLLALGVMTLRTRLRATLHMRQLTWAVTSLITLGIVLLAATWLLALEDRAWLHWLMAGATVEWAAILAAAVACLRGMQLLKSSTPP